MSFSNYDTNHNDNNNSTDNTSDFDHDINFGSDPHFSGSAGFDVVKVTIGCFALIGAVALGATMFSTSSDDSANQAAAPPVVPMYLQAQQAAIEAMRSQQQVMNEMRMRMAEADGYYEEDYYGEDNW